MIQVKSTLIVVFETIVLIQETLLLVTAFSPSISLYLSCLLFHFNLPPACYPFPSFLNDNYLKSLVLSMSCCAIRWSKF